jgi:polyisoprenoid-binding protein YceI
MTVRYTFDSAQSRFTVQAFATGMLSVFGHNPTFAFRRFSGELRFDPDTREAASLQMTVDSEAIELIDNVKPQDRAEIERRMRQEVLVTTTYKEIRFQSTEISANKISEGWYRLQIKGELTLRGVTKTQQVDAQLRIADAECRLSGVFKMLQSPYGIPRISAVGGTITLKDELNFSFDILGHKQDN